MAINKSIGEGESICAHILTKWIKITPPAVRNLTEEQKAEIARRLHGDRDS